MKFHMNGVMKAQVEEAHTSTRRRFKARGENTADWLLNLRVQN
jgi:hypothetical protein